jgi:hypothetical protein
MATALMPGPLRSQSMRAAETFGRIRPMIFHNLENEPADTAGAGWNRLCRVRGLTFCDPLHSFWIGIVYC